MSDALGYAFKVKSAPQTEEIRLAGEGGRHEGDGMGDESDVLAADRELRCRRS